jgi:hypothetical protein
MNEQNTTPEREAPTDSEGSDNALREFAKQFTVDESKGKAAEKPDGEKPPEKVKPKDLNALAETLGIEVKDLYDMEIPSDKLKGMTLGKLKDHMAEREKFTVESLKFAEDKAAKETGFLRAEQELQTLIATMPKELLKPEMIAAAKTKHEAVVKAERQKTIEIIPEWQDPVIREKELGAMATHMQAYGFPENYLMSIIDSRTMRYIRDNWQRKVRIDKALADVVERKPANTGKSKTNGGTQQKAVSQKPKSRQQQEVDRFIGALNKH